jgi:uncharacterized protein (TIGR00730 family)
MDSSFNQNELNIDIDSMLKKYNIDKFQHYQVLKEFITTTVLYHWEEPLIDDLIPLKEGMEEIRQSIKMFKKERYNFKISVFGSARTPVDHPLYKLAWNFSKKASLKGYKIITGAGPGIMEAGNLGAGPENSFGLGLKLPYESKNTIFNDYPEHLTVFNNFYSRKHIFYREANAIVVFPGGFGTMDEIFQGLTTLQTGKKRITPFILLDEPNGKFWKEFDNWVKSNMYDQNYISMQDRSLYDLCFDEESALQLIENFYKVFHSCLTYNDQDIFFQLKKKLSKEEENILKELAEKYGLIDMMYMRERYYPNQHLFVYRFSQKKIRDFVKIKIFIEELNKAL